jgi:hypothetical protein
MQGRGLASCGFIAPSCAGQEKFQVRNFKLEIVFAGWHADLNSGDGHENPLPWWWAGWPLFRDHDEAARPIA